VTSGALWLRIAATTALALALTLAFSPPRPAPRLPWALAAVVGAGAGGLVALGVTRRRPRLPDARLRTLAGLQGFLALLAANEELIWRRFVLGELLRGGVVLALVVSSVGFALAHPARRLLHLLTGAAFGLVYVSTGMIVASISAHWAYNALVWAGSAKEGG
jgi:membrane protease YdiL (CAAX protease family)